MDNVKYLTKKKGNLHEFVQDFFDPVTNVLEEHKEVVEIKVPDDIKSVKALFDSLAEEDCPVAYVRCSSMFPFDFDLPFDPYPLSLTHLSTISRKKARTYILYIYTNASYVPPVSENANPTTTEIDALANTIRKTEGNMVFVDANGADRTTFASALALLLTNAEGAGEAAEGEEEPAPAEEAEEGEGEGEEGGAPKKPVKAGPVVYNPEEPDFSRGEYTLVMKLVSKLNGEETEEEKTKRESVEESLREAAVAKAIKVREGDYCFLRRLK
jgi:hypothetical protein